LSTFIGGKAQIRLESEASLAHYFQDHAKAKSRQLVGLELEIFGVHARTGRALPYSGPAGIESVLKVLAQRFEYESVSDNGHIIALQRRDAMISLEPGGQVELSAPPAANVFEIEGQIRRFFSELSSLKNDFPENAWIAFGIQPFSLREEIEWVPKTRYKIMAEHMSSRGSLSHDMMKCTATNQVNFDYQDEEDAMESLRVALSITSIVTALFANSPFSGGAPNGFLTRRLEIWNHTDPARTGIPVRFLEPGKTFRDYLDTMLEMPMFFIVRDGSWIPMQGRTFRNFLKSGYESWHATLEDFELHLSTSFPEARIKQYLEVRGMDCQSPPLIPAVAAFWKGLLYRRETKREALKLVEFATLEDRMKLHQEVPRLGLAAKLGGRPVLELARDLVDLSCESLSYQTTQAESRSECVFLKKIRTEIIETRQSPAERFLAWYHEKPVRSPAEIVDRLSIG